MAPDHPWIRSEARRVLREITRPKAFQTNVEVLHQIREDMATTQSQDLDPHPGP